MRNFVACMLIVLFAASCGTADRVTVKKSYGYDPNTVAVVHVCAEKADTTRLMHKVDTSYFLECLDDNGYKVVRKDG